MSRWVIYEEEPALLLACDETTDLCEIQRLTRNYKTYQGKTTHSLHGEAEVVPYSQVEDPDSSFTISQYFDDLFVINDGDEDYCPSPEESDSEISECSLESECSAAGSPEPEQDAPEKENMPSA